MVVSDYADYKSIYSLYKIAPRHIFELIENYKTYAPSQYKKLIDENLLIEEDRHVFIPKNLWYISNSVIVRLLEEEVNGE